MALVSGDWSSLQSRLGGVLRTPYGVWIATALLVLILYINKRAAQSKRRSLPPGPVPWPLIGNLHLIATSGKLLHHTLASLAEEYGPLMTLKLGSHTTVVVTSAKMAKEILKTQNQYFCSRFETAAGDIMHYQRRNVVWAPYGEYLRGLRKVIQTHLLSNKRIESFTKIREEEVLSSIYTILEACQGGTVPFALEEMASQLMANNMSRMILGKSFFGRNSEHFTDRIEFMQVMRGVIRLTGAVVVGDFISSLKRFDLGRHEAEMRDIAIREDRLYASILEEHRRNVAEKAPTDHDFVDTMLALRVKDALSETSAKAVIGDMFVAGTDTSAHQVCWLFAELMRHPEVLRKAVDELDSVVGRDRLLTEADIPNLKYLQAIVKEALRLHPVAVLLPYESTQDTVVDGYHIPAKTRIFVNNYAISRSPESWADALKFIPERFLESARDVRGQDFEMMPFGAGRRMCIGMNLGLLMVQLSVGQMLQLCNWSLAPGLEPEDVDMTEAQGISISMNTPVKLVATPRLAPSILNDFIASLG